MSGIIIEPLKIVYWPVLKVASSSILFAIKSCLKIPDGPLHPIVTDGYKDPSGVPVSGQGLHTAPYQRTNKPIAGYKDFAAVRHPMARLWSLYKEKIDNDGTKYLRCVDRVAFPSKQYRSLFAHNMPFNEFLGSIEYVLKHPERFEPNLHFATQSSQIPKSVKAVKLEDIGPFIEIFVPIGNKSKSRIHWSEAYSQKDIAKTSILYSEDFERFGY